MAVYVDDARIPARVGRIRARWSHLFADSQDELHAFAQTIGLKRAWFQPGSAVAAPPRRTMCLVMNSNELPERQA